MGINLLSPTHADGLVCVSAGITKLDKHVPW